MTLEITEALDLYSTVTQAEFAAHLFGAVPALVQARVAPGIWFFVQRCLNPSHFFVIDRWRGQCGDEWPIVLAVGAHEQRDVVDLVLRDLINERVEFGVSFFAQVTC